MALSVGEQNRRIRKLYPDFELVLDCGFMGVWEGPLAPVSRTYRVRITYVAYNLFDGFVLGNPRESVVVLDPPIGGDPRGTGERAQHTYYWDRHPDFPRLCLHDPWADDWNPDMHIADTIIPFVIDWLFWHEDWVATGVWRGKGRHPEAPAEPVASTAEIGDGRGFMRLADQVGLAGAYPGLSSQRRFDSGPNHLLCAPQVAANGASDFKETRNG